MDQVWYTHGFLYRQHDWITSGGRQLFAEFRTSKAAKRRFQDGRRCEKRLQLSMVGPSFSGSCSIQIMGMLNKVAPFDQSLELKTDYPRWCASWVKFALDIHEH